MFYSVECGSVRRSSSVALGQNSHFAVAEEFLFLFELEENILLGHESIVYRMMCRVISASRTKTRVVMCALSENQETARYSEIGERSSDPGGIKGGLSSENWSGFRRYRGASDAYTQQPEVFGSGPRNTAQPNR